MTETKVRNRLNDLDCGDGALPAEFLRRLRKLEETYLTTDDPIRQSGFSGGAERWRREREPILEALPHSGELLDVCCANGYLLESLRNWDHERGLDIVPSGIDYGAGLIEIARKRLPEFAQNFHVANAWDWQPSQRYRYVYALWDCVPPEYLPKFVQRLMARCVAPRGRLILGAYGSGSRNEKPFDVAAFLASEGYHVTGAAHSGNPPVAQFAWIDRG